MEKWSFLTKHARVLVCIAHDPGVRLRDIATMVGITERSAYGIVDDLTSAGYVVKDKDGRRNRYQIQAHLPLRRTHRPANGRSVRCWRSWSTQTSPSEAEEATGDQIRAEARWLVAGLQGPNAAAGLISRSIASGPL